MGSIDRKQRNRVWNRYLRKDNKWVKGHFLLPQVWAAWRKNNSPGSNKQLCVAASYDDLENTLMWAFAGVFFIPPRSRKTLLTFSSCPFAVTDVQKVSRGLLSVLGARVWYFPLSPKCIQQQRDSQRVWGTGSGSTGVNERDGETHQWGDTGQKYTHTCVFILDTGI